MHNKQQINLEKVKLGRILEVLKETDMIIHYLETDTLNNKIQKIKRVQLPSEIIDFKKNIEIANKKLKYNRYKILIIKDNFNKKIEI